MQNWYCLQHPEHCGFANCILHGDTCQTHGPFPDVHSPGLSKLELVQIMSAPLAMVINTTVHTGKQAQTCICIEGMSRLGSTVTVASGSSSSQTQQLR